MSKYIYRLIVGLIFIASMFLSGCNSLYVKVDTSPPLKTVAIHYTEIYQFKTMKEIDINFIRNDHAIAIATIRNARFINLESNRLIKEIKPSDRLIYDVDADEKGDRYVILMDHYAHVFNTGNGVLINRVGAGRLTGHVAISKDGTLLHHNDSIWNVDTGEKIVNYANGSPMAGSAFSNDGRYFIQTELRDSPNIIDINTGERLDTFPLLYIEGSRQVIFRNNTSWYLDYGRLGLPYPETLGLFDISLKRLAEITPYKPISCWTRFRNDTRLIMGLTDGDVLVLDEKLKVLDHWSLGSKALKCVGGKNGRAWLATESQGVFEIDINKKTIANPVQFERPVADLQVSVNEKYISLIEDVPGGEYVARVYLNNTAVTE